MNIKFIVLDWTTGETTHFTNYEEADKAFYNATINLGHNAELVRA